MGRDSCNIALNENFDLTMSQPQVSSESDKSSETMPIHHPDHAPYRHFTKRQRVDKAVHTLTGLLKGVAIDGVLNAAEVAEVLNWCQDYSDLIGKAPFTELNEKLDRILDDGSIDPEEQDELLWVCANLMPDGEFYDAVTQDMQTLHGIMHGIMADGVISEVEAKRLQEWIDQNDHLKGSYPYDELDSLLTSILKDGKIDEDEQQLLSSFFEDFIEYSLAKRIRRESNHFRNDILRKFTLPGICAVCPEITFDGKVFTFTGSSMKGKRKDLTDHITRRNGVFSPNITLETQYLVVGAGGNPCWAFSCYGRKVQKAVEYRKEGVPITIVHESDFWDALLDG